MYAEGSFKGDKMTSLKEQIVIMGAIYLAGFVLGFRSMIGGEVGLLAFTGGLITFFVLLFGVHEIGRQVERKREYMLGISAFLLIILTSCGMSSIVWD